MHLAPLEHCFQHDNEPWFSTKKNEQFLEELNRPQVLKNVVASSIQLDGGP
jgi:hypothetical protein